MIVSEQMFFTLNFAVSLWIFCNSPSLVLKLWREITSPKYKISAKLAEMYRKGSRRAGRIGVANHQNTYQDGTNQENRNK